jgi:hypothetical protein
MAIKKILFDMVIPFDGVENADWLLSFDDPV